jgi:DNA-binding beta-propeller fold protein YncE
MFGSLEGFANFLSTRWRNSFAPLLAVILVGLLASACGTYVIEPEEPVSTANYEVWTMDQTNNILYIISPQLEVVETVDLSEAGLERTHWIDFTSDHEYAWIASTVSGNTAVIRAEDRKVIATFDTGPASHAADIYPDDSGVLVSVIKTGELVEIVSDHAAEAFSIGRRLIIAEDPLVKERADEFPSANPISSAFTRDGRYAYVTLGPALANGGLVILDLETFTLVKAYSPEEVKVNLMSVLSPDGAKMFVTGGSRDAKSLFYVFDTATHEVIAKEATRGAEAHGMALTPDGSEIWITNRWTGNVGIMSTEYNDFIERIPFVGEAPDLLAFSPDGVFAFILLRGGGPTDAGAMSGAGELPAVVVVAVETRRVVDILIQGELTDEGELPALDYHGIAIRQL